MFATTLCHSSRERRVETTTLSPWHGAHIRSTTALPGASGNIGVTCARAIVADRCKAAARIQPRLLLQSTAAHQVNGKSAEPMRALVVLARDAAQPSFSEIVRQQGELSSSRVARWQLRQDSLQHPGSAEIQPNEVSEFSVRGIGDVSGLQINAAQKVVKPGHEVCWRHHAPQDIRFREARRQEILA